MSGWRRVVHVAAVVLGATGMVWAAPAMAAGLPDGRRYELVSPADKNGGDVIAAAQRTRAAADGSSLGFTSLAAFGDAAGIGVSADYLSERSGAPGTSGWSTHAITPPQDNLSFAALLAGYQPLYVGEFSPDAQAGVFFTWTPLTDDPGVAQVANLYRRPDLQAPGVGAYELLSACPLCDATATPLPAPSSTDARVAEPLIPWLAGGSPDLEHIAFESRLRLTADAPAQPPGCSFQDPVAVEQCRVRLYEWDAGTLSLAGVLPDGSPADGSIAGQGAGRHVPTPDTVSDGSDGHERVFFTQPTDAGGNTSGEVSGSSQAAINKAPSGTLFVRVDHAVSEQLNRSERGVSDVFRPATFLDASADGSRSFFMTAEALTDDAAADGQPKLYMYDASKPGSAPDNLTLVMGGGAGVVGTIGVSADGHFVYFLANSSGLGIFVWHDGAVREIGRVRQGTNELRDSGTDWILRTRQSRVTPDGRHLLFSAIEGGGLTGYDHGACATDLGDGCRELYLYSTDSGQLACVSCNPSGAPATGMATDAVRENIGGSQITPHDSHALSDDGSRVFFSTPEALVPQDTNGRIDAYEYDAGTGTVALLSSGTDPSDSWFLDASASGDDAFFVTRERLVGWDVDSAYDVYDARVGGGVPEPPHPTPSCSANDCQGLPAAGLGAYAAGGSAVYAGHGNVAARRTPAKRCKRGTVKRVVRGKRWCVRKRARRASRAHGERRGS